MTNPKEHVNGLFQAAVAGEKSVSLLDLDGNVLGYYDEKNDYERHYYYDDTQESIKSRILMDAQAASFLPKDKFTAFLIEHADPNTIMVLEKLVFLWDNDEGMSPTRDALENEYGDEYAQYIAEDFLGQTWTDRQIPVINVSAILESCYDIHMPGVDSSFTSFFLEAVLQTMFHELRHLFYECNEIVSIGKDTPYPQDGGIEDKVEDYGNTMAAKLLDEFTAIADKGALEKLLSEGE